MHPRYRPPAVGSGGSAAAAEAALAKAAASRKSRAKPQECINCPCGAWSPDPGDEGEFWPYVMSWLGSIRVWGCWQGVGSGSGPM